MKLTALRRYFYSLATFDFFVSVRETFINMLPLYIINALLLAIMTLFDAGKPPVIIDLLRMVSEGISTSFPYFITCVLSYNYAKHKGAEPLQSMLLSFTLFLSVAMVLKHSVSQNFYLGMISLYAICVPVIAINLMRYRRRLTINLLNADIVSPLLFLNLNLLLPYIFILMFGLAALLGMAHFLSTMLSYPAEYFAQASTFSRGIIHIACVNIFWFFGIHGTQVFNMLFGENSTNYVVYHDITFQSLISAFVFFGGCGSTFSIVTAYFLFKINSPHRAVVKLSAPLQLININEIITYGYSIVLNFYLLIPFVLVPIVNYCISYVVVVNNLIPVTHNITWIYPIGFNAYRISGGSYSAVLFQIALILLGTLIYLPFLKAEARSVRPMKMGKQLSDFEEMQTQILANSETIDVYQSRLKRDSTQGLVEAMSLLESGELCLWYQPKINVHNKSCTGFEALLRLKKKDGTILGPFFLDALADAGYSNVIDSWVVSQAIEDMKQWALLGFFPHVSVNISDSFLKTRENVYFILNQAGKFAASLELEILEKSTSNHFEVVQQSVELLSAKGVKIAIDDYGTGYSNITSVNKLKIATIKMDKSLLDNVITEKGDILYKNLCSLNKQLGYELVAEGVETKEQAEYVAAVGIDYIQGWYHAKAMPADQAMEFALQTPGVKAMRLAT